MSSVTSSGPGLRLPAAIPPAPALTRDQTAGRLAALSPLLGILVIAVALRVWALGVPFASSDQVSMPHLLRHSYGLKWIIAHSYGPTVPLLLRSIAQVQSWLGIPIGEAASRWPIALLSTGQVVIAYALARRLWFSRNESLLAALLCALLPPLVTDAHYAWGYLTTWLLLGSLALWATLAYIDKKKTWLLVLAAASTLGHCLSNCFAFGVPATLLVIWLLTIRRADRQRGQVLRNAALGFLIPCLLAAAVILACWMATDQGQIGRLIAKQNAGATSWSPNHLLAWSAVWLRQVGYLFAIPLVGGLVFGITMACHGRRTGLLALWASLAALPIAALCNPSGIGYPGAYLMESVFAGSLLAVAFMSWLRSRLAPYRPAGTVFAVFCAATVCHLSIGAADATFAGSRLRDWTNVTTGWGSTSPDTGIKAAGWYIREHVPLDAVVMPLHTNRGMEAPVAEYYLGRRVIAGMDVKPAHVPLLLTEMAPHVDVIIAEPQQRDLLTAIPDFVPVCTFANEGRPVRLVLARPALGLPAKTLNTADINPQYDRQYTPRRVPLPLPQSARHEATIVRYWETLRKLKTTDLSAPR